MFSYYPETFIEQLLARIRQLVLSLSEPEVDFEKGYGYKFTRTISVTKGVDVVGEIVIEYQKPTMQDPCFYAVRVEVFILGTKEAETLTRLCLEAGLQPFRQTN